MTEHQEAIPITCTFCSKSVLGKVAGSHFSNNIDYGPPNLTLLAICSECGESSLYVQEDYGDGWDEPFRLWPAQGRTLGRSVPQPLRDEHRQARICFESKAYTAAVVMVRRTLEGVCQTKGVTSRNLFEGLGIMKESGDIDERLFEWAQELRIMGNEGAHFTGKQVARQDAEDALDLCEALLDYMFELSEKFEAFKKRRDGNEHS